MKVWKDRKTGEWIDFKTFKERFSQGVQEINPFQQAKVSLQGQFIILIGIVSGLIATGISHIWWLFTILIGSLIVSSVATLGGYQKYILLKKMYSPEELLNEPEIKEKLEEVINEQTRTT